MSGTFDPEKINDNAFSYYPRLSRVREYCESRLADALTLDEVAAQANLERSYFSSYFHSKVGVTFNEWLQHLRVSAAKRLLLADEHKVADVGRQVGFKNLSTFERTFRKHIGSSPSEYRANR